MNARIFKSILYFLVCTHQTSCGSDVDVGSHNLDVDRDVPNAVGLTDVHIGACNYDGDVLESWLCRTCGCSIIWVQILTEIFTVSPTWANSSISPVEYHNHTIVHRNFQNLK